MGVLVTGGAGFLGRHLARAFSRSGLEVTVLDDLSCANSRFDSPELVAPNIRCIQGSTLDVALLTKLVRSHEIVVHLASVVGVEETIRNPILTIRNLEGTRTLVSELTSRHTAIFGSSADVYGAHSMMYDREMREDDLDVYEHAGVNRWVYSRVKSLEEVLFAHTPARTMSIRFFNCYGPAMDMPYPKRVVPQFVGQVLRREPLKVSGDGSQRRTMCYFQDLVDGVMSAVAYVARQPAPFADTINLGGTDTFTVLELAHLVIRAALDVGLLEEPLAIETHAALYSRPFDDGWHRVPSLDKARRLFDYAPRTPIAIGLRRTLEYHLEGRGAAVEPGCRAPKPTS